MPNKPRHTIHRHQHHFDAALLFKINTHGTDAVLPFPLHNLCMVADIPDGTGKRDPLLWAIIERGVGVTRPQQEDYA